MQTKFLKFKNVKFLQKKKQNLNQKKEMQCDNQHLLNFGVEIDFDWRKNEDNHT